MVDQKRPVSPPDMRQRNATSWDYENGTIEATEAARWLPEMRLKESGVHPLRAAHV